MSQTMNGCSVEKINREVKLVLCERLGRLLCSRKISVFWPWLHDQKENLIGLMKGDTVKLTTEI